jgi:rhamnose transport system permease protein
VSALLRLRPERLRELSLVVVIAAAVVIFSQLIDNYLGGSFFNRVTASVAITAILAAGQTIVILTRNIDLSVGSIVGITAYVTGEFLHDHPDVAPVLAVAYAIAIGGGLGLLNGLLVAYARTRARSRRTGCRTGCSICPGRRCSASARGMSAASCSARWC